MILFPANAFSGLIFCMIPHNIVVQLVMQKPCPIIYENIQVSRIDVKIPEVSYRRRLALVLYGHHQRDEDNSLQLPPQ
jgi:hypothetical protein